MSLIFPLQLYCLNKESGCVTATQNIGFTDVNDVKKKRGKSGWLITKFNCKIYKLQAFLGKFVQLGQKECLEKVELVVDSAKLIGRYKIDISFWEEK